MALFALTEMIKNFQHINYPLTLLAVRGGFTAEITNPKTKDTELKKLSFPYAL